MGSGKRRPPFGFNKASCIYSSSFMREIQTATLYMVAVILQKWRRFFIKSIAIQRRYVL